jgi:hypothetical protein
VISHRRPSLTVRLLLQLALLAFVTRALIPTGFMPASLGSGWPLQPCPQSFGAAELAVLLDQSDSTSAHAHHHHHHHHHHHGSDDAGAGASEPSHCPLGLVLSSPALVAAVELPPLLPAASEVPRQADPAAVVARPHPAYRSRAPPVS